MWKDEITKSPEQRHFNNINKLDMMIRDTEEFAMRVKKFMEYNERYLGRESSDKVRTIEEVGSFLAKAGDMLSRLI